jgi:DNA-binding NtrC family response regulator
VLVRKRLLMNRPAILLVDDDLDILTALQDLLEHDGYLVTAVSTCHDTLEQLRTDRYAALLLDNGLPDGDGLLLLQTIQETRPTLPVLILTAYITPDLTAEALSRGAFACLTKPYDPQEIKTLLRRAVSF